MLKKKKKKQKIHCLLFEWTERPREISRGAVERRQQ
jgi:hypothetical protein